MERQVDGVYHISHQVKCQTPAEKYTHANTHIVLCVKLWISTFLGSHFFMQRISGYAGLYSFIQIHHSINFSFEERCFQKDLHY